MLRKSCDNLEQFKNVYDKCNWEDFPYKKSISYIGICVISHYEILIYQSQYLAILSAVIVISYLSCDRITEIFPLILLGYQQDIT